MINGSRQALFSFPKRKKVITLGIYSQIKEQVSTRVFAEHYGYKVSRNGMMRCPFHDDRNPSMKVDKNFICFGCQEKGDVIRFASKLFCLPAYEAAGKLIEDMGLLVDLENRPDAKPGIRQKAKRKRQDETRFQQTVDRVYNVYCDYVHLLNEWADVYAPRAPDEDLHPLFVEAMHKRDYVEYLLDLLLFGSKEDKAQVIIEKGKGVIELEKRIREFKSGDRERTSRNDGSALPAEVGGGSEGASGSDGKRTGQEHGIKRGNDPVL